MIISIFLDVVSPIRIAIPVVAVLVAIAIVIFGVFWLIKYLKNRKK